MSTLAFSRTRRPIGGRFGAARRGLVARGVHVPLARARGGEAQRVVDRARLRPRRSGPGPGGSAGRRRRQTSSRRAAGGSSAGSKIAPEPAFQRCRRRADTPRTARRRGSGRGRRRSRAGRRRARNRLRSGRPRGSGYGPLSDSAAYWNVTGTLRWSTRPRYGMPIGAPLYTPDPKSGWTEAPRPMRAMMLAEFLATGRPVDPAHSTGCRREDPAVCAPGSGRADERRHGDRPAPRRATLAEDEGEPAHERSSDGHSQETTAIP